MDHNNNNLGICEAYGCNELAKQPIEVGAGAFGILEFNVCSECVKKFKEIV
jgi:hypothetical protein